MKIRKAELQDTEAIKELLKTTWLSTYKDFIPENIINNITSAWHSSENIKAQIQMEKVIFKVAELDNQVVGLITLKAQGNDNYFLNRLYINSKFHGKGIGQALLNDFISTNKVNKITLEVLKENGNAIKFYEKFGFIITREVTSEIEGFKLIDLVMEYTKNNQ